MSWTNDSISRSASSRQPTPSRRARAYGCVRAQSFDLVGQLPRHAEVVTSEMPISRGRQIDRAAQVHAVDDRPGPEVEMPAYEAEQLVFGDGPCAKGLDRDRGRMRPADRVRHLYLAPVGETRGNEVLRDVPRRV